MTHTITPPDQQLVRKWIEDWAGGQMKGPVTEDQLVVAAQAAQWGADQELEACCQALYSRYVNTGLVAATAATVSQEMRDWLRAARRPKPPTLKEQALEALERMDQLPTTEDKSTIRLALEALPE